MKSIIKNIKEKYYNIVRNYLKKQMTDNLGIVVETEDKLICYVSEKNIEKNASNTYIYCHGNRQINEQLAKKYNLNKKICYFFDGIDFEEQKVNIFGYNDCEIIFNNCFVNNNLLIINRALCKIKNSTILAGSNIEIETPNLQIENCHMFKNYNIMNYPLNIKFKVANKVDITDSFIGTNTAYTKVILEIKNPSELKITNSKLSGSEIEINTNTIIGDSDSLINAENLQLDIDTLDTIHVKALIINYNGNETTSNYTEGLLQELTPLTMPRLQLIDVLKKVKDKCETSIGEKTIEYNRTLNKTGIGKILKK